MTTQQQKRGKVSLGRTSSKSSPPVWRNHKAIEARRIQMGLSLNQFSQLVDLDPRTYAQFLETGQLKEAKMKVICLRLGLKIQAFMPEDLADFDLDEFVEEA